MNRITVHIGHYGSGKTELSLNKIIGLAKAGEMVTLVDADIVNPYFRSGEHKQMLEEMGIKIIRPNFEGTNVDTPSLPADVSTAFVDRSSYVVIDVGGDASGARAIGRYHAMIESDDYCVKCIVNMSRPFTSTCEDIISMVHALQDSCRLSVDTLVNSTNLALSTTADIIVDSQPIIEQAATELGISVGEIAILDSVVDTLPIEFRKKYSDIITPIKLYMRKEWMDI